MEGLEIKKEVLKERCLLEIELIAAIQGDQSTRGIRMKLNSHRRDDLEVRTEQETARKRIVALSTVIPALVLVVAGVLLVLRWFHARRMREEEEESERFRLEVASTLRRRGGERAIAAETIDVEDGSELWPASEV